MTEKIYYNAASIALESNYRKLTNLFEKSGSWQTAWGNLSDKRGVDPEKEWARLLKSGVGLILKNDSLYPESLKEISQPPPGIYFLGNLPEETAAILAIVGTRKSTNDGRDIARRFAETLGARGITIASGLALGIDAAAHEGCLAAKGKTVAILGCGLDTFYPRTNERLAKKIIEGGGAIISEYPLGSPPLPHKFLERNRIVSGLSRGTLVIEAPKESGSLVTARHALDQNRDVFVIPGPISHPNYAGSNRLIRQGGELVTTPDDILEAWGMNTDRKDSINMKFDSEAERIIFEILSLDEKPLSADDISERTGVGVSETNRTLTMMILKNTIREEGGGYVIKQ